MAHNHEAPYGAGKGRSEILRDYHLRVGQITQDTRIPEGYTLQEQRLDETEVGEGTVTLIDAKQPPEATRQVIAQEIAAAFAAEASAGPIRLPATIFLVAARRLHVK